MEFFSTTLNDKERLLRTDPLMFGSCRSRAKYQLGKMIAYADKMLSNSKKSVFKVHTESMYRKLKVDQ